MACELSPGASAATWGCLLTRYLVEGPACDGSRKREWALGGLDGCDKDKMCLVSTCEQDEDFSRERVTSSLSVAAGAGEGRGADGAEGCGAGPA